MVTTNGVVPPVKKDESFKYFDRFFNFNMDNKDHKDFLISNLHTLLKKIKKVEYYRNKFFYMITMFCQKSLGI